MKSRTSSLPHELVSSFGRKLDRFSHDLIFAHQYFSYLTPSYLMDSYTWLSWWCDPKLHCGFKPSWKVCIFPRSSLFPLFRTGSAFDLHSLLVVHPPFANSLSWPPTDPNINLISQSVLRIPKAQMNFLNIEWHLGCLSMPEHLHGVGVYCIFLYQQLEVEWTSRITLATYG